MLEQFPRVEQKVSTPVRRGPLQVRRRDVNPFGAHQEKEVDSEAASERIPEDIIARYQAIKKRLEELSRDTDGIRTPELRTRMLELQKQKLEHEYPGLNLDHVPFDHHEIPRAA